MTTSALAFPPISAKADPLKAGLDVATTIEAAAHFSEEPPRTGMVVEPSGMAAEMHAAVSHFRS